MDLVKLELSMQEVSIGAIAAFLVKANGDMDCGDLKITEFPKKYEVISIFDNKMDKFDMSSSLYLFLESPYFTESKKFFFGKKEIFLTKDAEYTEVFQKIEKLLSAS